MKNLLNGIALVGLVSLLGCGGGGGGKGGGGIITACETGTCPFGSCSANQTLCIEYLAVSPATAIASLGPACAVTGGTTVSSCSQAHDPNFVGECDLTETVTTGIGPLTTKERVFYPHSDEFPDSFGRGGCVDRTAGGTTFSDSHWTQLPTASGTGGAGGSTGTGGEGGAGAPVACNSLSLIGTTIIPIIDPTPPPSPAGGEISDGVYVLTAITYYQVSSAPVVGASETFQISTKSDGTRQRSVVHLSSGVAATPATYTENFSITLPYVVYNATGICNVGSYSLQYTATPNTIGFFYAYVSSIGGMASWFVVTFTKQP